MHNDFYVYYLIDPTNEKPFYVGKGRGGRMYKHEKDVKNGKIANLTNQELTDKITSILNENKKIIYKKVEENLLNEIALECETMYIKKLGRIDINTGILFNKTDGGEGATIVSDSTREKQRIAQTGRVFTDSHRKKLSDYAKNRPLSHRNKIIEKNRGKQKSDETILKISNSKIEYYKNEENRKKSSDRIKKITNDPKIKSKISNSLKNFYKENPESIEKLRILGKQQSEKRRAVFDSKTYKFIDTNGNIINIIGLRKYCDENNLKYSSMLRINRGERKTYKGYKKYEYTGS